MKKTILAFLGIIMIVAYATVVHASFIIDYGDGLKFNFENTVTVSGRQYQIDNIEYNSDQLSSGQYNLNAIDAIYGSSVTMDHYTDDIEVTGQINSKFKPASASAYNPTELTPVASDSPSSDLKTGASNKIAFIKSRSVAIDPGEYIVDTFVQNRVVTSFRVCLPTFTSTTGNHVGNVTCGSSNSNSGTGTNTNTNTNTNPPLTGPTVTSVLNNALTASSGTPVEVKLTNATIADTTAALKFSVKASQSVDTTLILSYGTATQPLAFDNSNPNAHFLTIHSESEMTVGDVHEVLFPPTLTGLTPGTNYYFQIKDTYNNKLYQKVGFTTTGTNPNAATTIIPASAAGLTITMNNPVITPAVASNPNGLYNVKISGTIKTVSPMRIGLALYYGDNSSSLTGPVLAFPAEVVNPTDTKTFERTLVGLQPGTRYYYKLRETTRAFDATNTFDFTTAGTAPSTTVTPYDPNATVGAIIDYNFPTNLGQPTGPVTSPATNVPTLVPCGKASDQLPLPDGSPNPDRNCQFRHIGILVGNVITFLLVLLVPLTVLACIYTGVQMILHRSVPADLTKYKTRLLQIGGGLVIMLLAFTIVVTVMTAFLGDNAPRYMLLHF